MRCAAISSRFWPSGTEPKHCRYLTHRPGDLLLKWNWLKKRSLCRLKAFVDAEDVPDDKLMWLVIMHLTFVVSAVLMGVLNIIPIVGAMVSMALVLLAKPTGLFPAHG